MAMRPSEHPVAQVQQDWYDACWLRVYFTAKQRIAEVAPHKLRDFTEAMNVFRTDPGFSVKPVSGLFDAGALAEIRETIASIPNERMELHEVKAFGRFIVHRWPAFNALQDTLVDRVSELAGEPVEASYNFLSLYTHLGVCEPHLDAPSAKWTLDVCIDQSEEWPIHFSQIVPWPETSEDLAVVDVAALNQRADLEMTSATLVPGDAVLFSGSSQWHYRNPLPRQARKGFCNLLFFHFIPAGTRELVQPSNWARIFDIPELADLPRVAELF